jgi:AraC-like DNA-binding protein
MESNPAKSGFARPLEAGYVRTVYRTTGTPPASRFEYWRSLMRQHFALSSGCSGNVGRFDADLSVNRLGPVTVMDMMAPWQRWTRAQRHLRSDPHDEFVLTVMQSGHGSLEQAGRLAVQRPGVISIFDTSKPYEYVQCGETLCVEIPRQMLLSRLHGSVPLAVPHSAESSLGKLLWEMLKTVNCNELPVGAPVGSLVGSSLICIVAALIETSLDRPIEAAEDLLVLPLERVRQYIRQHLGNPALSVESIAKANALSPRTLTRLFAAEATSPMRWVWEERLAASKRALSEGGHGLSVTDVAFANGFSDLSHFSRAFKSRYGSTPKEVADSVVRLA